MANLKFADTHNMVAFLSKPEESDGFEQIVDFLNAHPIKYALTVNPTIYISCIEQLWATVNVKTINGKVQLHALVDERKIIINESTIIRDLQLEDAEDEAVHKELGGGPRCQETMGDTIAQTRFENVSKQSNDPLLARDNTLQSGEDSLKLTELMEFYTNLQQRVLDLEKTNTSQHNEIVSLKKKVKKLEHKKRSRTRGLKKLRKVGATAMIESSGDEESLGKDASKQGRRINDINKDEDITLVSVQDDVDAEMFNVDTLTGDEVFAEQKVAAKDVNLSVDEVTLAQTLVALKSLKPKVKANAIEESSVPVSDVSASTKDKGKGKMVEEPVKSMKKKYLIRLDEEIASKLQAEFDEDERLAREKDEANVALTEEWGDIQAKIEADHELAQRLQAEEQEGLFVKEKAKLFQQLLEQRRKHFAAKRAEEQRNKPPT
ncbi:hypothetical protein Tco_0848100 [Tanacetum coccineum]